MTGRATEWGRVQSLEPSRFGTGPNPIRGFFSRGASFSCGAAALPFSNTLTIHANSSRRPAVEPFRAGLISEGNDHG